MGESRPREILLALTKVVAWSAAALTVLVVVESGGTPTARFPLAVAAAMTVAFVSAWAMRLGRGIPLALPPASRAAGSAANEKTHFRWQSEEAERTETRVRLALRSGEFFRDIFTAYLGSLAAGEPLDDISFWSRESASAAEGRQLYAALIGHAPGTRARRPSLRELEQLLGKVEEAYERGRRL